MWGAMFFDANGLRFSWWLTLWLPLWIQSFREARGFRGLDFAGPLGGTLFGGPWFRSGHLFWDVVRLLTCFNVFGSLG